MDEVQESVVVRANLDALSDSPTAEEILYAITGYSQNAINIALEESGAPAQVTYSEAVLADNPILYHRLDSTGGTDADQGSGGHTLTYGAGVARGMPALVPSSTGRSARFDSGTATSPHAADIDASSKPITFECWARVTSLAANRVLFSQGKPGAGGWAFGTLSTEFLRLTFFGVADITSTFKAELNTTYHLATIYKADNSVDFYANGQFVDNIAGGAVGGSTEQFAVGGTSDGGDPLAGGTVDEVAIYSGALSAARLAAHYSAGMAARV